MSTEEFIRRLHQYGKLWADDQSRGVYLGDNTRHIEEKLIKAFEEARRTPQV